VIFPIAFRRTVIDESLGFHDANKLLITSRVHVMLAVVANSHVAIIGADYENLLLNGTLNLNRKVNETQFSQTHLSLVHFYIH